MIEVNIPTLKESILEYKEILKKIEENNADIIYNFEQLSKYWQDERINKLKTNFNIEKQKIINLESNIKTQLSIYNELETNYIKLGNKIKCNLNSKSTVLLKVDNIISIINKIITQYNNLGDISFYPRSYIIYNQKKDIYNILQDYKTIRKNITDTYNTIEEIEKNVSEKLNAITIEKINLNNYESEE